MVAHDQHALVADRCGQRLLLLHVVRDAVVVIVRQLAVEVRRLAAKRAADSAMWQANGQKREFEGASTHLLVEVDEALFEARDRLGSGGVDVDHGADLGAGRVQRIVYDVRRNVVRLLEDVLRLYHVPQRVARRDQDAPVRGARRDVVLRNGSQGECPQG